MKKGAAKASTEGQESQKKVSFDTGLKKISRRDSQADVLGHILDRSFCILLGPRGPTLVSCVPAEAPLCQEAIRSLHYQRERHEVLQGEASIKDVTEPDVRGPGRFALCMAPPQFLAMNLVFCE